MKKLIPALVLLCLFASFAAAQLSIAPDGATALDGTVNFVFPPLPPFGLGGQVPSGNSNACPVGYPPSGAAHVSQFYWASYPLVLVPVVPPSGPIDAWAEPGHRSQ